MTAVYVAAFTLPFSRGDYIFNLVVGDVLTKAARQLEVSLRLYPEQPEAAQAREIIQEIDKGEDPTPDQLTKYLKFFTENLGARVSW